MMAKYGGVDKCPACQKSVYPMEKVLPTVLLLKSFHIQRKKAPPYIETTSKGALYLSVFVSM